MKILFITLVFFLVGCSDDSPVPRIGLPQNPPPTEPTEPTGEHNISIDSDYILQSSTLTDDDLKYYPEIRVTNHSSTEYMFFYVSTTDNGVTRDEKTVILNPNETRDIAIDLYTWMGGRTGSHYIKITIDRYDTIDETDETDNSIGQHIYILPPAAG